ncbi:hypothetical protein VOLCADRAFT_94003 [Volvox carteri f. nagariensis]|uniref:Helitron helicase-like domain-containing protein n=1 Tax=Volvox carteri f. nagariensis TaxID=3068 RepID=D8U3N3_VOLCA|nr:uncharacterized protein VOLCADRAFT_94003 [Volvox carteri f. nagariensis]EFJ45561.1 hypothetical protein VOLCADRAFT_94003 [Volvox carteri f. nagariensis]|eukprot:XP_002953251.1 hypothetical protein VOLCADRAFT_94003 [Volvox carteri f. nagariensis]
MDILFGFKPGDKRQSNPDCFCGTVFHICIKVEQSGRLALHLHGMAHLAVFTVDKMRALFEGPNCRALALAHTLCSICTDAHGSINSSTDDLTDATAEGDDGLTQAEPGSASGTDEDIGNGDNGVQPAPPAASAGRPPAIRAPQPDGSMPAPAYDFAIVTRGKPRGTGGEATDTFTPEVCFERCTQHLVAGVVGSCTHTHTDTCKHFGCAGVDGYCGMAYPRHIRLHRNSGGTACTAGPHAPEVLEDILVQAEVVARRTTHYATKYVAKATSQSQVTRLNHAIMISRHFLDTAAAGGGDPAAAQEG